ncbi:ABC transporter permease [Anaerolineae bacterium CFX9]|jgi:ABC-2 type transport system permease protein|nr:ABC transporter permease [Anaerolineae bacterium CFX9]
MALAQRILEVPSIRRNDTLRSFIVGAWLGWQIESNWASPGLFAIYSIARPVASVLILVVMYSVITDGALDDPLFAYIYLGNALYIIVSSAVSGISWAVIDDREHYRVNKQLHTTPMNHFAYLVGRGVARFFIGLISVAITVGFGLIAFRLPLSFAQVNWGLLLPALIFGVASMGAMGLILASVTMQMARHFWTVGESVTGALYLFTGAIFPLDVLPAFLRPIGYIFPVTYWLEAMRRALIPNSPRFETLAWLTDAGLIAVLAFSTIVLSWASLRIYRWSLFQSKEKGIIDMESNY